MPKPPAKETTATEVPTITEPTTTTTMTAIDLTQFASTGNEKLVLNISYGNSFALNSKEPPNHGYFVPVDSMLKAGFTLEPNHKNRYQGDTQPTPGYLFNSDVGNPRMLVLAQSLRAITLTRNGVKAGKGQKQGEIFGFYEDPQGKEMYQESKQPGSPNAGFFTLTTIYLVYFLDKDNKPLHKVPLRLSLKGSAAVSFGEALNTLRMQGAVAFNELTEQTISNEGLSLLVFEPNVVAENRGQDEQSLVSVVNGFTSITKENLPQMFAGSLPETQKMVKQFRAIAGDFTETAFGQYAKESGFHQLAPGVTIPQIAPAAIDNGTGEDVIDI